MRYGSSGNLTATQPDKTGIETIWPVVVALYQVKRWFLCPVPVMKALYALYLIR